MIDRIFAAFIYKSDWWPVFVIACKISYFAFDVIKWLGNNVLECDNMLLRAWRNHMIHMQNPIDVVIWTVEKEWEEWSC